MLPLEGSGPLGPLLPHDLSEVIIGLILFVIIFVVVWKVVMPRFESMYAERTAAIEGGMEKAERAQEEAQAAKEQYQRQLADANAEAGRIREDAKTQGSQILAEMREKANAESERILAQARAQIEAEHQQALAKLRLQVGGIATGLAGKIVGESLTDDERARRTVERFLADLEGEKAGQA